MLVESRFTVASSNLSEQFLKSANCAYLNHVVEDQKDEAEVKSAYCSCKGPRFSFQHPQDSSKSFVTPVPGTLMTSSGLLGYQASHGVYTYVQA